MVDRIVYSEDLEMDPEGPPAKCRVIIITEDGDMTEMEAEGIVVLSHNQSIPGQELGVFLHMTGRWSDRIAAAAIATFMHEALVSLPNGGRVLRAAYYALLEQLPPAAALELGSAWTGALADAAAALARRKSPPNKEAGSEDG